MYIKGTEENKGLNTSFFALEMGVEGGVEGVTETLSNNLPHWGPLPKSAAHLDHLDFALECSINGH